MSETTNTTGPAADEARAMIDHADQLGASVRSGAGWPQIATLLGLGAVSSMGVIALTIAQQVPGAPLALPIITMLVWVIILTTLPVFFSRSSKRGFGARWGVYIGVWALLWASAMALGGTLFEGELWFAGLMAALLTITTTAGALYEARR